MAEPLTTLLDRVTSGREGAFTQLVNAVYDDLRRIAHAGVARNLGTPSDALTNQPTAIVDEAVMELKRQRAAWQNREHFFAIATRLIMRLLAQEQRRKLALKRGGGQRGADVHELDPAAASGGSADKFGPAMRGRLIDLGDSEALLTALDALHQHDPRAAEVVTLHMLCGHSLPTVAAMLEVSVPTAERDWKTAKAFLHERLNESRRD